MTKEELFKMMNEHQVEEIVNHPSRKFLKPWREQQGDEAFFGFLKVFRMQHGKAHVWCMEDNFKPKEHIEL